MVLKKAVSTFVSPNFSEEVLAYCLKCGVCAQFCPITLYDPKYTPKSSYVYFLMSHEDFTNFDEIWDCCTCHYCEEVCPQDFKTAEAFQVMKSLVFERNAEVQKVRGKTLKHIIDTGFLIDVPGKTIKKREKLGLPPLELEKIGADLQKIAEKTELAKLIKEAS